MDAPQTAKSSSFFPAVSEEVAMSGGHLNGSGTQCQDDQRTSSSLLISTQK
jgi:hypothetical protein